jgi:1,2-diacylglycerol 3-beta-galactosyltransferase
MSDTGGGHRAAAEAIRDALLIKYPDQVDVTLVDVFKQYTPFPFNRAPELYPIMVNISKSGWSAGYNWSNTRKRAGNITRAIYVTAEGRMKRMLREHPADVIISVHSVLTRIAMQALMSQETRPPFLVVVTDLVSTHMFWYERRADLTMLPSRAAFDRGLEAGLDADHMLITGLPVHPRFAVELPPKAEARASLGWDANLPALLVMGGGEGMGPMYKIARALDERHLDCQLVIVAGRNRELYDKLQEHEWAQPTHIYGFVNDMPRVMAAADLLVTKAGPATISEACIAGLPMILYDAIPGQEEGNVHFVVDSDAGVFETNPRQVAAIAESWLAEGERGLRARAEASRRAARPDSVWQIADKVWEHAQHAALPTHRRSILKQVAKQIRSI